MRVAAAERDEAARRLQRWLRDLRAVDALTGERLGRGAAAFRLVEPPGARDPHARGVVYAMRPMSLCKHVLFTATATNPFTRRELTQVELARLRALLPEPARALLELTVRHGAAIRASLETWRASRELLELDCGERWAALLDADERGVFHEGAWELYAAAFRSLLQQSPETAVNVHGVHSQQLLRRSPLLDSDTEAFLRCRMSEVFASLPPKRRRTDGSSMIGLEKLAAEWLVRLRS